MIARRENGSEDVSMPTSYITLLPTLLAIVSLSCCSESSKESGLDNFFVPCGCVDSEPASSCGSWSLPR
jgi:hypothetical protein